MSPLACRIDLSRAAQLVVDDHAAAPCAVVAAALRVGNGFIFGVGAAGSLSSEPDSPKATIDTPFDLASVTKPVTALTMARLVRHGMLARDDRLGDVLTTVSDTASARVSLDLLTAHRAGLDAHGPIYAPLVQGAPSIDRITALRSAAAMRHAHSKGDPPIDGFVPVYSDLGYLLLGAALEERTRLELDELMAREVLTPLAAGIGSSRMCRQRDPDFEARVAPTEVVPFRGGLVRGVVHDENAWAFAKDAAAGHAGLFGTATDVVRLGIAMLDALADRCPDWLGPRDVEPLVRPRSGGSLLAGFDGRSGDAPSSGTRLGPRTFGHLGFTGTSLWIDPDAEFVGVLLSNRVHPIRASYAIKRARPAAYDAMFDAMITASDRG